MERSLGYILLITCRRARLVAYTDMTGAQIYWWHHHLADAYFGDNDWFQFSMNYASTMVNINIVCFDTRHPTFAPSIAPTTPSPTLAPTEMCTTIEVLVGDSGAFRGVQTYNGIYNKQTTSINGYAWCR